MTTVQTGLIADVLIAPLAIESVTWNAIVVHRMRMMEAKVGPDEEIFGFTAYATLLNHRMAEIQE
jgi:hypothetical protein